MNKQPLTKAERANILSASSADGYYAHDISRLCADLDAAEAERDALKAKLADLSEADEELHTCRALVNATSENLSVDLERMVDDLAEANEKAARSEKDSHSWHELYKDTKAKLAALVDFNVAELGRTRKEVWPDCEFCRDSTHDHECAGPELNPRWAELNAAIAAARGGAPC